jgi:hypothetical protein
MILLVLDFVHTAVTNDNRIQATFTITNDATHQEFEALIDGSVIQCESTLPPPLIILRKRSEKSQLLCIVIRRIMAITLTMEGM